MRGGHVVIVLEHDRLARMLVQAGLGGGRLDDRAVAARDCRAERRGCRTPTSGLFERADDVLVRRSSRRLDILAERRAVDGARAVSACRRSASCLSTAGRPPA